MEITKTQYKNALKTGRILIIGTKYTTNGWTSFRVFLIKDNNLIPIQVKAPYWNEKDWCYKCTAWGTDRRLEIILSIGYELGLKFHEIRQNYHWKQ